VLSLRGGGAERIREERCEEMETRAEREQKKQIDRCEEKNE
jgi:hypothetical protein